MNRIYRLVWNHVTNAWVCCAETAKGRGKSSSGRKSRTVGAIALAGSALISTMALAAPTGGQISAGSGRITQSGTNTTINQGSQNLAVNWQSFGIASNESVNFVQPNSSAIALNRVTGQSTSQIMGSLNANGQVFIINPNGVLFGTGAQVNVGGLVATTLSLSDADFMAGKTSFSGSGGSVVNQGNLTAAKGGYIALLAPQVSNQGIISATLGTALLAAGNKVTLTLNNGSLLGYSIDQGALNALAENKQLIQADGGQIYLTAKAADTLSMAVVNNTGVIEARTIQNQNGVIKLLGDMQVGTVNVGGTLDASAPNGGNGGQIETSAAHVHVANDTKVTTLAANGLAGTWLIDPVDFTVAATGGDMTGAAVTTALAGGNFTILSTSGASGTSGNVNVNDTVSWSANTLTLNAQNNININGTMNATGSASLALIFGQSAIASGNTSTISTGTTGVVNLPAGTTNFTTKQGSDGVTQNYTVITSLGVASDAAGGAATLQGMAYHGNWSTNYVLGANIDASGTSTWNLSGSTYQGFTPIGNSTANTYNGTFDGLGHTISGLTINRTGTSGIGLFGYGSSTSVIRNVGMVGGSVTGAGSVGGLVGYGLGTISNSYATGSVSGGSYVGGLVGVNGSGAVISNSYATGRATGSSNKVGGLVGANYGTISNSYATGNVSSTTGYYVGGLVGFGNGTISNSYATGNVSGASNVGGLVGYGYGIVSNSYATGSVSGSGNVGGLVGYNGGTLTANFWDVTKSGTSTGVGGGTATGATGLTTAQMQTQSSFTPAGTGAGNWDFTAGTGTWVIFAGQSNPLLRALMTPLTVTANNATKTYDGLAYNGSAGVTYSVTPNMANLLGTLSYTGGTNAGSYTITPSGLTTAPVQQGYIITYANGTLTVNPAPLTVTGISASNKVYDGTASATLTGTAIVTALGSDVVTVGGTGTGTFADANVGTGKSVTVSGYTLSGAAAGNYTIVQPSGLTANITAAPASTSTTSTNSSSVSGVISPELIAAINNLLNGTGLVVAFSNAKNVEASPIVIPEVVVMNSPITLPTPDNVVVQLGSGVTIVNGGIKLPDDMRTSQRNEPSIKGRGK